MCLTGAKCELCTFLFMNMDDWLYSVRCMQDHVMYLQVHVDAKHFNQRKH